MAFAGIDQRARMPLALQHPQAARAAWCSRASLRTLSHPAYARGFAPQGLLRLRQTAGNASAFEQYAATQEECT